MAASNTGASLQGVFETKPGEQFYMEFWARRDAAYNGTSGNSKLRLGNPVGGANVGELAYGVDVLPTPDVWVKRTYTGFAMPAEFTSLAITLGGDSTAGNVWLDDIIIRRIKQASWIAGLPASQITSGSFLATLIPSLDASKIGSGTFAQSMVTGLTGAIGAVFGAKSAGTNLVVDPGFEDWAQWGANYAVGFTQSTEQKHSGANSAKTTTVTGTNRYIIFNGDYRNLNSASEAMWWKVKPGDKLYYEMWVYGLNTNDFVTGSPPRLVMEAAKSVDSTASGTIVNTTWATWQANANTWYKFSGYYTVPAGYDRLRAYFHIQTTEASGNVWYVDDVMVREVTEAQNVIGQLFGGTSILGSILATNVPALDTSKITTGTFAQNFVTGLPGLSAAFLGNRAGGTNLASDPDGSRNDLWLQGSQSGTGVTTIVSTEQSLSGTTSIKLTTVGTGDSAIDFCRTTAGANALSASDDGILHVQPGDKFYAECYVRVHASVTAIKPMYVTFGPIDSKGVNPTLFPAGTASAPISSGWTKYSYEYTVPAGYDRLRVRLGIGVTPDRHRWRCLLRRQHAHQGGHSTTRHRFHHHCGVGYHRIVNAHIGRPDGPVVPGNERHRRGWNKPCT